MIRLDLIAMSLGALLLLSSIGPAAGGSSATSRTEPGPERLRVTTFNILHDGVRSLCAKWPERRPHVVALVRRLRPDVLCLQEVSARQLEELKRDLPEYGVVSGLRSGPIVLPAWPALIAKPAHWLLGDYFTAGEYCPIFLRRDSIRAIENGRIELPTPRPGRPFTPHQVNWARLATRSGFTFEVGNTHLGIHPWRARRSAREVLAAMDSLKSGHVQILTGDFNSRPGGAVLRELSSGGGISGFQDAWDAAAKREGGGTTFHWGVGIPGPRIDYVLARPGLLVRSAKVAGAEEGRPWLSDHWAVTVEYEITPREQLDAPRWSRPAAVRP